MQTNLPWIGTDPAAASSQLDPVEIPVAHDTCSTAQGVPDPETGLIETFRHSGWSTRRRAVLDALFYAQVPPGRLVRFRTCGSETWILRNRAHDDVFKTVTAKCHDRFCSPCVVDRQTLIRRNLAARLTDRRYRFLTLTLRHNFDRLRPLFNKLYSSFRRLRQTAIWKDRVDGGCSLLELTHDPHGHGWHPHIHCVLEGRYIDIVILRRLWLSITGDSTGVDISEIRNKHGAIHYVTKYSTKAMPASIFRSAPLLAEAVDVLARRRLLLTFGTWKNWRLLEDPRDREWEAFDSVDALRYRAHTGDDLAARVLSMMNTADPNTGEFVVDLDIPPPEE